MLKNYLLLGLFCTLSWTLQAQTPTVNAKKRTATITIDGNPNEASWEFTNNVTKNIIGTSNNTTKFAVLWDSLYLYVAFTVVDASKYNESTNNWDDDAVEIYLDAENNGGTAYGTNDRQFAKEWNSTTIWEKTGKTTNVLHAWTNTANGYAVELRIPWSNIGITNPGVGFTIGFDAASDDDDNGAARESQQMWSGDNDNWQYPRNFGDLVLVSSDTQAPSAPANLAASGITQSTLTLNWSASTDNIGVTGYDVYRNGTKLNSALVTTTNYSVSGLTAATSYQFYVRARDAVGNTSANSNTITVVTPDTQAPTAPSSLNASGIGTSSFTLGWTASTDNVGVTGYNIFQNSVKLNASPVSTNSFAVSNLSPSTTYTYYVQAIDAAGNTSNSSTLNVTTLAPPDTQAPSSPTDLNASALTQSSVTISWTASTDNIAVTGYDIYRDGVKLNVTPISGTNYNVTGLQASTSYNFYVQARDAAGNISTASASLNVMTPDTQAPTVPSNLVVSNLNPTSFTLSWSASTDNVIVAGYDLYQDNIKINSQLITNTTFNISGLNASTSYQFYVKAYDAVDNSTSSSVLTVTTPAPPDLDAPSAPTDLIANVISQNSVTLSWSASTDNIGVTGYDVYRNGVKVNSSQVTTTTYTVSGLSALTTYDFYVIAKDAAGNISGNSNTIPVSTPDTQSPTTPSGLSATNITATSLTVNWNASSDNVSVTGYDVYQNGIKINAGLISGLSFAVTGLTQATAYNFTVVAWDGSGNQSATANLLTVTTLDAQAPTAPTGLSSSGLTATTVNLNWTASTDNIAVAGYDVYRNGVKINASLLSGTTYSVTGLSASTNYSFYVQARDAANNISASSNAISVTTPAATGCTGTGAISFQRWNNVTGTAVSNLTSIAGYPNNPSATGTLTSFEVPTNSADNYGIRVYGYICPPTTGSYTFWIASDDNAELWLSTSSNSSNKTRIAYHTQWTNSREWNKYTTQKSAAITLTAGQVYYVEALMKEGSQGDNLAVGWAKPGQTTTAPSEVIPGSQLLAQLPDTQAPAIVTNLTGTQITSVSFTLNWSASSDNVGVSGYDVYQNNVKINSSIITGTSFNVTGLSAGTTYSYYVVAKDAAGNTSSSAAINVTTSAPDTQAPTVPTNLSTGNIGQTFVVLNWTASSDNTGVAGYDVYRNGVKVNSSIVNATTYTVNGLTPGVLYSFTLVAKDAAGNASNSSNTLNATTLLPNPGTETFTQRTVIANQRMPHDLVYGPDNNLWYTERFAGRVSFVNPATGAKTVVLTLGSNMVNAGGQDGLMGLALHPQFATGKPYVYISYTYQSTSSTVRKTRIARYTYDNATKTLGQAVTILENIPGSNDHNSARLAIGPDLKLYYTVGDMGAGQFDNMSRPNNAQDLNILEGKVLRLNTETISSSWIPADNPFSNGGQKTPVFSFGHRNPQGLVWGNVNGANILYSSEHGPYSDDEINVIESGRNYGWPQVAGFCDGNYNGRVVGGFSIVSEQANCSALNAKEPLRSLFPSSNPPTGGDNMTWPSTGPSGTDFYGTDAIPGWKNSLLVAQLKNGTLTRFKLSNDGLSIISDTIHYFRGKGRFRDVVVSPDGLKIYLACDSSGSTSGPTGGVTTAPANAGSILEFTYQAPVSGRGIEELIVSSPVTEELKDRSLEVYPNPANSFIVVYNYGNESGRTMELSDLNGRSLKKQYLTSVATRVDLQTLSNGLYIVQIRDSKGKILRIEKILVQK